MVETVNAKPAIEAHTAKKHKTYEEYKREYEERMNDDYIAWYESRQKVAVVL